jgi:hypothetical protein
MGKKVQLVVNLIKQTVSDSFIRLGHSSSLKNTLKILDFGFSGFWLQYPGEKRVKTILHAVTNIQTGSKSQFFC